MRALGLAVALTVAGIGACSGDDFSSESTGGAGGSAGSGGAAGSGGVGGSAGSTGGSGGGSGNAGASGSGGTSGAGATGGSAGSSGAGGSSGASGTGGAGGTGGSPPNGCGSQHLSATLLYTTLNDAASIVTPAMIENGVGTHAGGEFGDGYCDNHGFRVNAAGQYASFLAAQNLDLQSGTIDFFFRPGFDKLDNQTHRLLGVPGKFQVLKTGSPANSLIVGMGSMPLAEVASSNLPFVQDQWVRITIMWQCAVTDVVNIWFNGQPATTANEVAGPITPPALSLSDELFLGAFSPNDSSFANGVFDDFKVYTGTEPP